MSHGLGELIPYTLCPYPPIVSEWAMVQAPAGFQAGMGDILKSFAYPVPQVIGGNGNTSVGTPGTIPVSVAGVKMTVVPAAPAKSTSGMGDIIIGSLDIPVTAPGGYFSSGMDFSQWGIAEWGTVAAGVYVLFSLVGDVKRHARKSRAASKAAAKAYRSTT